MENHVEVRYLGQMGFVFRMGDITIMTDPYLSDYVDKNVINIRWKRNYPPPCDPSELADTDLVLLSHIHYDHTDPDTMIPLYAAGKTVFAGPYEVISQLKRWGFSDDRLIALEDMQRLDFQNQTITAIAAAHEDLHYDSEGHIRELSFVLAFENGISVFFGGDMCLYPGLVEKIPKPVTVTVLPINGRSETRRKLDIVGNLTYREAADLSAQMKAGTLIPAHFDLYDTNAEDPSALKNDLIKRYPNQNLNIMQPGSYSLIRRR
ncbi:MAG TPA: MBL fold metallo-hydrolase [Oscillospiraceae bacterium]|nr:MBL fold metallo-hydrolase [Oscillospiraceae bacterium]HPF56159.1 MBL fold metallo-hydrolase [Clostridiales bacterium]HPK35588.1 MBL fold metallo-hydrolase [Oscillospiraceae bacterium]HPR75875.1 MBL fold metallo-hydrolase [Oscillospiraceae bacterium]